MSSRSLYTSLLPLAAFALCGSMTLAQQASAPPSPPSPDSANAPAGPVAPQPPSDPGTGPGMRAPRPRMMQHGFHGPDGPAMMLRGANDHGLTHGPVGGGFRIGPHGMWWKNPMIVQRLTLTPDQVKRMDGIFQQSRLQLIDLRANVQKQEVMLEPLLSANPPDTAKAMDQIDKVADARAGLEKADAKMLLGIRGVLTPDQWTKLQERRAGRFGPTEGLGAAGVGQGAGQGRGRGPQPGNMDNFVAPDLQP